MEASWIEKKGWSRLPGRVAKAVMVLLTWIWSYWSAGEMYHEGWWGAWYNPVLYLIPAAAFMNLTLLSLRWPRAGGGIIGLFGIAAGFFFDALPIGLIIAAIGLLFWLEGRRLARRSPAVPPNGNRWWVRLTTIPPVLILVGFSAFMLPIVLTRVDDGDRSARIITGNAVTLQWAPAGPGWNWQQPWGGYPSWDAIALYGVPPIGADVQAKPGYGRQEDQTWRHATAADMARANICLYLSEDGTSLLDTPQQFWRMPTVDEYVRSLGRHGQNAGCAWGGEFGAQVTCLVRPDKETPLWAPDLAPIYYWAAEAYDENNGYFVSYNGFVNATLKSGGNPRHSYRCVQEVNSQ